MDSALTRRSTRATARAAVLVLASAAGAGALVLAPGAAQAASTVTVTGTQGAYVAGQGAGQNFLGVPQPYNITVNGTGFASGAQTTVMSVRAGLTDSLSTSDVSVVSTTVTSSTQATVSLQVPAAEAVSTSGAAQLVVVVTNSDGGSGMCSFSTSPLPTESKQGCLAIKASPTATSPIGSVGAGATSYTRTLSGLSGLEAGAGQLVIDPAAKATVAPFTIAGAGDTTENVVFTVAASPATAKTTPMAIFVNPDGGQAATSVTINPSPQLAVPASPYQAVVGSDFSADFVGTGIGNSTTVKAKVAIPFISGTIYNATSTATTDTGTIDFGTVPDGHLGMVNVAVQNADGGTTRQPLVDIVKAPSAPPSAAVGATGDGSAVINWTASTDGGSSAIVAYQITTMPDTGARSVPADQPLTYTLVGLTDGGTYTASVRAINNDQLASLPATTGSFVPNVPAATPTPTPTADPTATAAPTPTDNPTPTPTVTPTAKPPVVKLGLTASATTIALTKSVGFHGTVTSDGKAVNGTLVGVAELDAKGKVKNVVAQGKTDSHGNWSVAGFTPVANMKYVASALGTTSKSVAVNVSLFLQLNNPVISGRTITITGYATPSTSKTNVKVVLFATDAKGHRIRSIAAYTLGKKAGKGFSLGANAVTVKRTLAAGKYHLVVQVYGTATNVAASSKVYSVTIT